jgi:protein-S-isoprenylcysteine O-methyltransferase Ste14
MSTADIKDNPDVIALPPVILLASAGLGGLLHFLVPMPVMRYSAAVSVGVFLAVVSTAIGTWAVAVMKGAGTNVRPDRPALSLVRTGPYRFTRNPMYVAVCLLQLALGFILNDWIPVLITVPLALTLHFGVILREERYLERKFGEPYLEFKQHVRRWL